MKITKSQLIQIIREELQNERITVGSTPEETAANVAAVHGSGGAFDQRKDDHEIAKEIEGLLLFGVFIMKDGKFLTMNNLINEYISRNPSLLKEYSPAFLGLLDDEDDEDEANDVIGDVEDEIEDELEDEDEDEGEEVNYDDVEIDTSIGDEASRLGTQIGSGAGAVARFVLATAGELVNQLALGTYPLIMK
ncbi:MAG: hypothetical protein VW270_29230, partial [Candidatus Poseidoniales archaeon]